MKKIKSLQDVQIIVDNKLDIKNDIGDKIPLFVFLGFKLFKILEIIRNGEFTYDPEF